MERLLRADTLVHKEACHWMTGWYKDAFDHTPPTARVNLDRITTERVYLYFQIPPPGEKIPVYVEPLQM